MRPFLRSGRLVPLRADFEYDAEQQKCVAETLRPYLTDSSRLDEALDWTERAVNRYLDRDTVFRELRPGAKKPIAEELRTFSKAAAAYLMAANGLGDEARERLADFWTLDSLSAEQVFGSRVPSLPRYSHPVDPDDVRRQTNLDNDRLLLRDSFGF